MTFRDITFVKEFRSQLDNFKVLDAFVHVLDEDGKLKHAKIKQYIEDNINRYVSLINHI